MDTDMVWTGVDESGGTGSSQESSPGQSGASSHDASTAYIAPRTRQRVHKAPPPLAVPDINEDAAERKRVLNVLAQRRYRERKRQKKKPAAGSTGEGGTPAGKNSPALSGSTSMSGGLDTEVSLDDFMEAMGSAAPEEALEMCFPQESPGPAPWAAAVTVASPLGGQFAGMQTPGFLLADSPDEEATGGVSLVGDAGDDEAAAAFQAGGIDPSSLSVSAPSASPPASGSAPSPDSYMLPMTDLAVLRAIVRISQRLNAPSFLSLDAASPFISGAATAHSLPAAWRPTPSQLSTPHHPIIDFLPWPGVREKLLAVMTLPDELRPEGAAGPMALVNFAYDLEDGAEGMRVYGEDVYDPGCWEVGQVLFERWWFLFDREIVENSNRWRRLRGARALSMGGARTAR